MKLLTLSFILALSVSSISFADELGQDNVATDGAVCEHRINAEKAAKATEKKKIEKSEEVIKS